VTCIVLYPVTTPVLAIEISTMIKMCPLEAGISFELNVKNLYSIKVRCLEIHFIAANTLEFYTLRSQIFEQDI
jgi:hypothetical protein